MTWYILCFLLGIIGIVCIAVLLNGIFDYGYDGKVTISFLIAGVIFLFLSYLCWNQGIKYDLKIYNYNNKIYTQKVTNKQYKEQLGIIDNISSNAITIKDYSKGYYLNKDSEIKNFNNFKPGDKVDVYYIVNGYDCNIIISIEKIN
jgi:hypothetical protein